jgi:hypothetical protein
VLDSGITKVNINFAMEPNMLPLDNALVTAICFCARGATKDCTNV